MKKLVTLLFLIPLTLLAQQNAPEWHLGISIKPEVSAMTIHDKDESSKAEYGFTGGLTLGYNIAPSLTFETGIYYGIKNISHSQGGLIFGSDIDPQAGVLGTSELIREVQLNDIEIPIQAKYFFFKQLYFRSGLGINLLSERSFENRINHSDGTTTTIVSDPESYLNYSATIGIGYMQPIGEKMNFNIEPFIKYYFRDNIIPITHLYNIGLNAALTLKL